MGTTGSVGRPILLDEDAPEDKIKVFVSYSRQDAEFVGKIVDALSANGDIHVFRDTDDILPTEAWKERLANLISQADTIVFCLSPRSAISDVCRWEIAHAERLKKRIMPIVVERVEDGTAPEGLAKLNYIFFDSAEGFGSSLGSLVQSLRTDIGWIREHTRIGELSRRWAQQKTKDELLRGAALRDAEQWVKYKPHNSPNLTDNMIDFLAQSHRVEISARRLRTVSLSFIGLLIVALVFGYFLYEFESEKFSKRRRQVLQSSWISRDEVNRIRKIAQKLIQRPKDVLSNDKEKSLRVGQTFRECQKCPEMIVVPGGQFMMGGPKSDGHEFGQPQHLVRISKSFAVSKFEITFEQWDKCAQFGVCENIANIGAGAARKAVHNISWTDAQQYTEWLTLLTGKNYRLLTEAEWEYAARAGTNTTYYWGAHFDASKANCCKVVSFEDMRTAEAWYSAMQPDIVGSYSPNQFGLYDMLGNVSEWVADDWHDNYSSAPTDGSAWVNRGEGYEIIEFRVHRGGSIFEDSEGISVYWRHRHYDRVSPAHGIGFRVARDL